jgi:hypothetical protein
MKTPSGTAQRQNQQKKKKKKSVRSSFIHFLLTLGDVSLGEEGRDGGLDVLVTHLAQLGNRLSTKQNKK